MYKSRNFLRLANNFFFMYIYIYTNSMNTNIKWFICVRHNSFEIVFYGTPV